MNYNLAKFCASYGTCEQLPTSTKLEIAFTGRSNVGKSSLLNKLFNRKALAKVSSVPGKTATINFFEIDPVYFVDLPGYGYAKVSKSEKERWSDLINGYFQQDRNFGCVVSLIDLRHPATSLDIHMLNYMKQADLPFIIAATKSDKLSKMQVQKNVAAIKKQLNLGSDNIIIALSSQSGAGIDTLRKTIDSFIN